MCGQRGERDRDRCTDRDGRETETVVRTERDRDSCADRDGGETETVVCVLGPVSRHGHLKMKDRERD